MATAAAIQPWPIQELHKYSPYNIYDSLDTDVSVAREVPVQAKTYIKQTEVEEQKPWQQELTRLVQEQRKWGGIRCTNYLGREVPCTPPVRQQTN